MSSDWTKHGYITGLEFMRLPDGDYAARWHRDDGAIRGRGVGPSKAVAMSNAVASIDVGGEEVITMRPGGDVRIEVPAGRMGIVGQ